MIFYKVDKVLVSFRYKVNEDWVVKWVGTGKRKTDDRNKSKVKYKVGNTIVLPVFTVRESELEHAYWRSIDLTGQKELNVHAIKAKLSSFALDRLAGAIEVENSSILISKIENMSVHFDWTMQLSYR